MPSYQFLRKWNFIASEGGDSGLDLSQLRCTFTITKQDAESPNTAEFEIFGLAPNTVQNLKKSFTKVMSSGGYQSNFGLLFAGNIKGFEQSRESLKITAGDGDTAYNYTIINKTLAAGASPSSIVQECIGAMGVGSEYLAQMPGTALPRGKVLYGRPREFMREQAINTGCTWSIQDGKVLMLKRTELAPGTAVELSKTTGLIGVPSKTEDGITGRCLLNPKLKIGSALVIKSEYAAELNGTYRIIGLEHKGDTRGNDWYTDFTCILANGTGTSAVSAR